MWQKLDSSSGDSENESTAAEGKVKKVRGASVVGKIMELKKKHQTATAGSMQFLVFSVT